MNKNKTTYEKAIKAAISINNTLGKTTLKASVYREHQKQDL